MTTDNRGKHRERAPLSRRVLKSFHLSAFIAAIGAASPPFAAVFLRESRGYQDPRVLVQPNERDLDPIGVLEVTASFKTAPENLPEEMRRKIEGGAALNNEGSGFLISECLVVTNHHVAFAFGAPSNLIGQQTLKFTGGLASAQGRSAANSSTGSVVAHGRHGDPSNPSGSWAVSDWAIVKLDRSLGRKLGWMEPDYEKPFRSARADNWQIASTYYDLSNGQRLYKDRACSSGIFGIDDDPTAVEHDCSSLAGVSGAPVFRRDNNDPSQPPRVVGINKGGKDGFIKDHGVDDKNLMVPFALALPEELLEEIKMKNPCPR